MYNKTSFINETDYAKLVGLCGICPIMRKVTKYAQNYALALSHDPWAKVAVTATAL